MDTLKSVQSPKFLLIHRAMIKQDRVCCWFQGFYRELCVHEIGYRDGEERIFSYQVEGESSKGWIGALPPNDRWRCMRIAGLSRVTTQPGEWVTGVNRGPGNACMQNTIHTVYPDG